MTELESVIAAGPPERIARDVLLADSAAWGAFNMLWKSPHHIWPTCQFFGLTTVAEAEAFAASLRDGSGWVTRRDQLSAWLNPRPGVWLADMVRTPWSAIEAVVSRMVPRHAIYHIMPNDAWLYVPTLEQAAQIMRNCPAHRFPWRENDGDCDDQTDILRGWRSEHGIGPVSIGWAGYRAFIGQSDVGGHALGLGIVRDAAGALTPILCEPRDGKTYPITYTRLGGFHLANRIAFQRAMF